MDTREVTVEADRAGMRLDAFMAAAIPELSRMRAKALIQDGQVAVARKIVTEPKRSVVAGDTVRVTLPPPEPAIPVAEDIPLNVVFEDAHLIVIDKPAGLVVHPAPGHSGGTLVNALIAHCGDSLSGIGGVRRPGIVHRLDKDTTGLLVAAKTDAAHKGLAEQFADHGREGPLVRGYKALVWGVPSPPRGTVEAAIARSNANRKKMAIARAGASGAREAITHYEVEEAFGPKAARVASLLSLQLETGRTHQIRVHLAALGNSVVGDPTYGAGMATKVAKLPEEARLVVRSFNRQALHAWLLGFRHPATGKTVRFESDLPADIAALLKSFEAA